MRRLVTLFASAALLGCGKDSSGPSVDFPPLDQILVTTFCVRGDKTAGQNASGSITSSDCDAADIDPNDAGYYETWRIRVASGRNVTFTTNAQFDTYLTIVRIDSWDGSTLSVTILGENDDIDPDAGNFNSRVTVNLQPGFDYIAAVQGYDYGETGSYSLTIN
jgi:hypothetical protein